MKSPDGFFIEAISPAQRFWLHCTEGAFTLIPNFLLTGIVVVLVSLAVIFWSVRYIHLKHGATVFLFLRILLTLVGGGIGHLVLFLPTWGYATRINKPLHWWRKILPGHLRKVLRILYPYSLAATALFWLTVMELGIFGWFPGQSDAETILNIVFICLFSTVILANATFICGFARDMKNGSPKRVPIRFPEYKHRAHAIRIHRYPLKPVKHLHFP